MSNNDLVFTPTASGDLRGRLIALYEPPGMCLRWDVWGGISRLSVTRQVYCIPYMEAPVINGVVHRSARVCGKPDRRTEQPPVAAVISGLSAAHFNSSASKRRGGAWR